MTDPISTPNSTADIIGDHMTPDVADVVRELGLKSVRAWVVDEHKKARTAAGERSQRSRAKGELRGFKQLSITFPTELHPMLKTLAARTKAGEPAPAVLAELWPELSAASADTSAKDQAASLAWLKTLPAELHPMLKTLVARTQSGEPPRLVLAELLPEAGIALMPPDGNRPEPPSSWLDTLPAWRRWLLRWLLPSGVTIPH